MTRPLLHTLAAALLLIAVAAAASLVSGARLATIAAESKPSIASCASIQPRVDAAP